MAESQTIPAPAELPLDELPPDDPEDEEPLPDELVPLEVDELVRFWTTVTVTLHEAFFPDFIITVTFVFPAL